MNLLVVEKELDAGFHIALGKHADTGDGVAQHDFRVAVLALVSTGVVDVAHFVAFVSAIDGLTFTMLAVEIDINF